VSANPEIHDVVVVGGCGRVGLPLAIAFATQGLTVHSYDLNDAVVKQVNDGTMPFDEPGADELLREALAAGRLRATTDPAAIENADAVVIVIGTPVDEHLNPDPNALPRALVSCNPYFRDGQLIVLKPALRETEGRWPRPRPLAGNRPRPAVRGPRANRRIG